MVGQFQRGGGVHGILLDGYLLVGEGEGDKNDWGVSGAEEEGGGGGGMGPALDGLTDRQFTGIQWTRCRRRRLGRSRSVCMYHPPAAAAGNGESGNVHQLFLFTPLLFCALSLNFLLVGPRARSLILPLLLLGLNASLATLTLLLGLSLDLVALAAE